MHTAERIAMWVVIALIVFFLFFKQTSGFTNKQTNLMSLAEFNEVPQPLKDAYVQNMTPIVNALVGKIAKEWNGMKSDDQKKSLAQISEMSKYIASNINMAPDVKTAINPMTHTNVFAIGGTPMPMTRPVVRPMPSQPMPMPMPMPAPSQPMPMPVPMPAPSQPMPVPMPVPSQPMPEPSKPMPMPMPEPSQPMPMPVPMIAAAPKPMNLY